jgi:hypothetical protein
MLQNLFNTDEALLQTVKEHPYFTPAQFFLLQQTKRSDDNYTQQIARTSILFNNPLWLNFQMLHYNKDQGLPNTGNIPMDKVHSEEKITSAEVIEEVENKKIDEEEISPIKIDLKLSVPDTKEETIHFEPLHTSDYFASQGIKLSDEVKPDDKLGKQLKSFTEWLKTMKKVHAEETLENNPITDVSIQNMAEKSNAEDIILTEAMADVLIQQGKTAKAIEVYQKLSLLNPSKSAYFAAKIEQFKG